MRVLLQVTAVGCVLFANSQTFAGEISRSTSVGRSDYAYDYFPRCRHGLNVKSITSDMEAMSLFLGISDAGVIGLEAEIFEELSKYHRRYPNSLSKGGSRSTCVAICVQAPSGASIRHARFYINGHLCSFDGATEWRVGASGERLQCGGEWSGLKGFSVGSEGACAVFANWKHDRTAEATLVLAYD